MLNRKNFIILTLSILFMGCNSSSNPSPSLNTKDVTVSDCQATKTHRTNNLGDALDNNHTYISYQYENSRLSLTHHNVAFNCDKRGIGATSKIEGEKITITERQNLPNNGGMDCECLFDVSIILKDIEAKNYTLNYDDGRSTDIHFDIDLATKPQGIKSFNRQGKYPYGQASTTPPSNPMVKKLISDEFYNTEVLPDKETKVIKTQTQLDSLVVQLKEIGDKKVDVWAKTLEESQIDFDKSYLVTHTFEEECIYEYASTVEANSDGEVSIRLDRVREECDSALAQYYLAHQISKEVKSLKILVTGHDPVVVLD